MKKLLNISVIAALAILPMAANATPIYDVTSTDPGATNASGPEAQNAPKYSLAAAGANDDTHMATAGYVKGAYNAAIKAVNRVAATADSAVKGVQVNGSDLTLDANGKANVTVAEGSTNGTVAVNGSDVAVHGLGSAAYTASTAYATAAQGALADSAVQSVAEGSTNGTVSVDGTDVAVHGLGSAAYTASTAYATAAQGALADTALQAADLANYATQDGVENTIATATITATVPTLTTWGNDSSTGTVDVTVDSIAASYAEPTNP